MHRRVVILKMIRFSFFLVLVVLLLGTNQAFGAEPGKTSNEASNGSPHGDGFGCELIQSKLDFLEYRFSELFVQLQEQAEGFLNNQQRVEAAQLQLNRIVERHERKIVQLVEAMEDSFGSNVSLISDQSRRILELQTICSNHELIRNSLFELRPKNVTVKSKVGSTLLKSVTSTTTAPVCSKQSGKTSGLCLMDIGGEEIVIYMEQHRFGGDWLILLQRFDGSDNFNRNWTDYRDGFGTVGQEFWLGLERLHVLTNNGSYELLVELEDFAGNYRYARFNKFSIGAEADLYPLKELGTYSGTAGDSLTTHKGAKFTTLDKGPQNGCVASYTGGWWYNGCYDSHLTGKWDGANAWTSIIWKKFGSPENTALKFARMMIRKI